MRECGSWFGIYRIDSSSGEEHYFVTAGGTEGPWYCTCPAFMYSKALPKICKHIKVVANEACLWHEQWGGGPNEDGPWLEPYELRLRNSVADEGCSRCGNAAIVVRVAV